MSLIYVYNNDKQRSPEGRDLVCFVPHFTSWQAADK